MAGEQEEKHITQRLADQVSATLQGIPEGMVFGVIIQGQGRLAVLTNLLNPAVIKLFAEGIVNLSQEECERARLEQSIREAFSRAAEKLDPPPKAQA